MKGSTTRFHFDSALHLHVLHTMTMGILYTGNTLWYGMVCYEVLCIVFRFLACQVEGCEDIRNSKVYQVS